MLIYADLEDAIIARVKAAAEAGALGYRLAEVDSYGGQFDDETFWTSFRKFPAVWVTVGGDKPQKIAARKVRCTLTVAVMVGARHVRGERLARRGSVSEPGSYQLLDDVRRLLAGQDFGLAIAPLALGPARTLYNTRIGAEGRSILAAEFATDYVFTLPDPLAAGDEDELLRVALGYRLKPGDDGEDAADLVTLRG